MKAGLILLLILLCIVTGCKTSSKTMKTDYSIKIGGKFEIELPSNPSTGYSWKWSNKDSVTVVESISSNYEASHPQLIGSGGKETCRFKWVKAGNEVIKLEYKRSWESQPAADTKEITVKVE